MRHRIAAAAAVALAAIASSTSYAQAPPSAASRTSASSAKNYVPPKTPWGDPDLQGTFTNKDENGIPMERPTQFEGRRIDEVSSGELSEITSQRNKAAEQIAPGIGGAETGAGPVHWYEYYNARNSRAWLIVDPADGRIPQKT